MDDIMTEQAVVIPVIALSGITVAALFPGADIISVMGAAGGSAMFSMLAYWIPSLPMRVGYFLTSWLFGIIYSVEGYAPEWLGGHGIKAFCASFAVVMLMAAVVEFVRTGKLPAWVRELLKMRLSRGDSDAP
jgi:hypothetical protein